MDVLQGLFYINFANLYTDTAFVNGIQLYRKHEKQDDFLILFLHKPGFDHFNFCLNYLWYADSGEDFSPFLRAYYKTGDIHKKLGLNLGQYIMIYVSKDDEEYDNVNLVNEKNRSYLYEFTGHLKELENCEEKFHRIQLNKNDYEHVKDVYPNKRPGSDVKKSWWKFW